MILKLLAICGLAYLIKESDGPFDIICRIRNWLLDNKYCGLFFYKLLSCYFCIGTYCGALIYLLDNNNSFSVKELIIWFLAGGSLCYIIYSVLYKFLYMRANDELVDRK